MQKDNKSGVLSNCVTPTRNGFSVFVNEIVW